jgi:hypothetical protein
MTIAAQACHFRESIPDAMVRRRYACHTLPIRPGIPLARVARYPA